MSIEPQLPELRAQSSMPVEQTMTMTTGVSGLLGSRARELFEHLVSKKNDIEWCETTMTTRRSAIEAALLLLTSSPPLQERQHEEEEKKKKKNTSNKEKAQAALRAAVNRCYLYTINK